MKIRWTNKHSGEVGYVKSFTKKNGHFVNTYDINEAKEYKTEKAVNNAIRALCDVGEAENNTFDIVD